jgi:hypothetical protein
MMIEQTVKTPWYRQPWVWLLIAIPGSSVVVGFTLYYLAQVSFDGMVVDDYYKKGIEINRVLRRDHEAATLGLSGDLRLNAATHRVRLQLAYKHGFNPPSRLNLQFLHATRAGFDQQVALIHKGHGLYVGTLPPLHLGSWYLELGDPQWRLSGELIKADDKQARLQPAV